MPTPRVSPAACVLDGRICVMGGSNASGSLATVEAYLELAEHLPGERFSGGAFNFGNETPVSVLELVGRILRLMGRQDLQPVVLDRASHEIPRQYLDCSKARRLVPTRRNANSTGAQRPTRSSPDRHARHQPAARRWKRLDASWA